MHFPARWFGGCVPWVGCACENVCCFGRRQRHHMQPSHTTLVTTFCWRLLPTEPFTLYALQSTESVEAAPDGKPKWGPKGAVAVYRRRAEETSHQLRQVGKTPSRVFCANSAPVLRHAPPPQSIVYPRLRCVLRVRCSLPAVLRYSPPRGVCSLVP